MADGDAAKTSLIKRLMNKASDEDLMREVQKGDRDSAAILVHRYASILLTYIVRMINNHSRAEELVQDVFLAIWEKRQQYEYPRAFQAWMFTIATNRCRLHFRQRKPQEPLIDSIEDGANLSPAESAGASETQVLVARAVANLPQQQRTVVALRIWNGLSYAEIAEVVQCGEATARSHMHNGLVALRQALAHLKT